MDQHKGFDALGDVLIPAGAASSSSIQSGNAIIGTGSHYTAAAVHGGGATSQQHQQQQQPPGKVLTGDLESSLASLAENLTINKSASAQVK